MKEKAEFIPKWHALPAQVGEVERRINESAAYVLTVTLMQTFTIEKEK